MATTKSSHEGQALNRLEQLRCPECEAALMQVRASEDPEAVLAELEPVCLEYVELALLTTTTVALHAARWRGASRETIEAIRESVPPPLRERLQEMALERWAKHRPQGGA